MRFATHATAVVLTLSAAVGSLGAQHCLGVGNGPVAPGAVRGSVWTGEHRYARRTGVALASAYRRFVGSVSAENIYDAEFAATVRDFGLAFVADIPADDSEGLWICPALQVNVVLGPYEFTHVDESRYATDLSAGIGLALPIAVNNRVRVVPSLSGRYVSVAERWTREDFIVRRRGKRLEVGSGAQLLVGGEFAVAAHVQIPFAAPDDRTFPFWRQRSEIAWQLVLSHQIRLRGR